MFAEKFKAGRVGLVTIRIKPVMITNGKICFYTGFIYDALKAESNESAFRESEAATPSKSTKSPPKITKSPLLFFVFQCLSHPFERHRNYSHSNAHRSETQR